MSSERLNSTAIELGISRCDELIRICRLFDDEREKLKCFSHFKKFCECLFESEENNNDENSFNEGDTVDRVIETALDIKNYEYKIKTLKILMVYWNKRKIFDRVLYDQIKHQILSSIPSNSSDSIFKMSEEYIETECNRSYFELCFLLKQNQLKHFEFKLEELIENYKKFYGDYWKYAMKNDLRYLKEIAENRRHYKTVEFIFHKCHFVEINSNIKTQFEEIKELIQDTNGFSKEDEAFLDKWRNIIKEFSPPEDDLERSEFRAIFEKEFKDNEKTRKLLFGRVKEEETNLLEEMLIYPYTNFIFECAWDHFRLWTKPEIFLYKNPSGKTLFDFAIESGGDEQLGFLLMPKSSGEASFDKRKHFMVMKNNQVYIRTGKCVIEHLLEKLIDDDNGYLFGHFVYLLEEIGNVKDLKNDRLIEKLISLAKNENFFEQITGLLPYDNVEMARQLFHIEDIIGNMMVYWSPEMDAYPIYKNDLENVSPFYQLMFLIIEKRSDKFIEDFQDKMTKLEESFETRYHDIEESERYSSNMLFIMLLAAIKTKQRTIIDFIFSNDTFSTINFEFSKNIVPEEIHYYTALKFLKYKHGIGYSEIPKEWLTSEVLEDFFDSQISFNNQELIEIDCTSLIHVENQKKYFDVKTTLRDSQIMRDDPDSLEYIISHENLKALITHPVIETYINLKSLKYQRIFTWNFWAFVIFFILPFILLIMHNNVNILHQSVIDGIGCNLTKDETSDSDEHNSIDWSTKLCRIWWKFAKYCHIVGIIFLFIRESFQCYQSDTFLKYFKKLSNMFEILLFTVSILLSYHTLTYTESDASKNWMKALEVILILFTTISATSILPFAHVPNNMQILRKVALTFLRIFYTFAIILIAFSFSFCIMFRDIKERPETSAKNEEENTSNCVPKCEDDEKDALDNFDSPLTSFIKIITMLSGEYEIQPTDLPEVQLLFFLIFVISSFILFNLILGLSIEDVQELKKSSRFFDLMTKSERFIEVSRKVEDFYINYEKDADGASFIKKLSFKTIRFFLSKYVYLHNIAKVMVDIKTKQVFVKDAHKHQTILKRSGRLAREEKYYITKETFKDIQNIINLKNKKMFKHLKKKLDQEEADGTTQKFS